MFEHFNSEHSLPTSYGGCSCACHRMPGVSHVMACCGADRPTERPEVHSEPEVFDEQSPVDAEELLNRIFPQDV